MALDTTTTDWTVRRVDGYWHYVSHAQRLATSGWRTRAAALLPRNANGYADTPLARRRMAERYETLFPKKYTMADIRAANKAAGRHFFDRETMQFFRSKVEGGPYQGPGGIFFVTSEKRGSADDSPRAFTVREFDSATGDVRTAHRDETAAELRYKDDARNAARTLAKGKSTHTTAEDAELYGQDAARIQEDRRAEDTGPNLDGMFPDDLLAFWAKHQRGRAARELFPSGGNGTRRATADLANYASNKATAMQCRARGDLNGARMYEDIAERIYESLPAFARW